MIMQNNKTLNNERIFIILFTLFYFVWDKCYNFYAFVDNLEYDELKEVFTLGIFAYFIPYIINTKYNNPIAIWTKRLIGLYVFTIITSLLFWNQNIYSSIRALSSSFFVMVLFFVLDKNKISVHTICKTIIILFCLYSFFLIICNITFPNNIFGCTTSIDAMDKAMSELDSRGVIRFAIAGADFVPMVIFMILTHFKDKKRWYLLLFPLFIVMFMRGTRTPLFITMVICLLYYIFHLRNKIIAIILVVVIYLSISPLYFSIINSKSDDPFVKYIQLTTDQVDENDEDIRIEMSKYYLEKFNDGNILKIIFGNGVPGSGSPYANSVNKLSVNYGYWVVDVGLVEIFVYFGLTGLLLYTILFLKIFFSKVSNESLFAKLMILYFYMILPTNSMLLSNPIAVSITLYVLYKGYLPRYNKKVI